METMNKITAITVVLALSLVVMPAPVLLAEGEAAQAAPQANQQGVVPGVSVPPTQQPPAPPLPPAVPGHQPADSLTPESPLDEPSEPDESDNKEPTRGPQMDFETKDEFFSYLDSIAASKEVIDATTTWKDADGNVIATAYDHHRHPIDGYETEIRYENNRYNFGTDGILLSFNAQDPR